MVRDGRSRVAGLDGLPALARPRNVELRKAEDIISELTKTFLSTSGQTMRKRRAMVFGFALSAIGARAFSRVARLP